ncbi:MAG: CRISPR-associated protein Cas4 [Candidatus Ratteibacteria bacterium]
MRLTGTLIWYYYICEREVWLMSREITPDQEDPFIEIGRLLSEESYKREKKEIRLEGMVIDILKIKNGEIIIGEVKKSSKFEKAAKMQLAFYLSRLKKMGIDAKGELLFPKEKKKIEVNLTDEIINELQKAEMEIKKIIKLEKPPLLKKNKFCKNCSYKEFCFS